ncbi:T9SS type A sorting domain-containing protein [Hymenobacter koreensis]|uniref:Secretion system C-terminal sorting domain-containing protein n=1 Tax=Hymenobacter koreensis TaxID=1084523 RepID=A0ABP8IWG9_9BACT
MKTFTRLFFAIGLLLQLPAAAANFTITVGDNFYAPAALTISPGDVVTFQWQSGNHPTVSDNNAFPTFPMNSSARTRTLPAFTTPGQFAYHCQAHGAPLVGMFGIITVSAVPTSTLSLQNTSAAFNVYPNPARGGQVTLKLPDTKLTGEVRLRVSNIIGSEVRRVSLRPELLAAGQAVDLSSLPAGIYFCNLLVNDKVVATKRVTLQE